MTPGVSLLDVVMLLVKSRRSNIQAGITGALVHGKGQFMQVLEGPKATVTALYHRIACDARHESVVKLLDKPIQERSFLEWSMACCELSAAQAAELQGYVSPEYWEQLHFIDDSLEAHLLRRMREIVLKQG